MPKEQGFILGVQDPWWLPSSSQRVCRGKNPPISLSWSNCQAGAVLQAKAREGDERMLLNISLSVLCAVLCSCAVFSVLCCVLCCDVCHCQSHPTAVALTSCSSQMLLPVCLTINTHHPLHKFQKCVKLSYLPDGSLAFF